MKTREIYVTNNEEMLTLSQFENGLTAGIEYWVPTSSYPIKKEKVFCSAKSLAEYLLQNGVESEIRSAWDNKPISKQVKEKVIEYYKHFS